MKWGVYTLQFSVYNMDVSTDDDDLTSSSSSSSSRRKGRERRVTSTTPPHARFSCLLIASSYIKRFAFNNSFSF